MGPPGHLEPVAVAGCGMPTAGLRVEETPRNIQEEGETVAASGHPGKGGPHALLARLLFKLHIPVVSPPSGHAGGPIHRIPTLGCHCGPQGLCCFSLKKKIGISKGGAESSSDLAES